MDAEMIVLPIHTREFRPAHEYSIMFKLVEGDYYHVPAAQVQQICPELQAIVDQAVQDGTATTEVFEVPRFLEQEWKDWWTVNDYIEQGKLLAYLEGKEGRREGERRTRRQNNTPETCSLTKHTPTTTGCELTTYEPLSSFLTDARVYLLATSRNLHAGAEAAVAATQDRAAEILDCLADTESIFDPRAAVFHLESLLAAAQLACNEQPLTTTEGSGGGADGGSCGAARTGLRAMVVAACATLRPLLAELPALQVAVAEDAGFAALWERLNRGGFGSTRFTPEVRERMQWAIESCGS